MLACVLIHKSYYNRKITCCWCGNKPFSHNKYSGQPWTNELCVGMDKSFKQSGQKSTCPALSVYCRIHSAGCLAEDLWIGLSSALLQLWAESESACQPLYGNEQGQSQKYSSMCLQRAAVCKLCWLDFATMFG